ncbi:MAG: MBL fold metallo-hydrolase [Patescibacteria group bacterium]|nr:MBL fold metallo-hydrolase [Patescibacteria group bacterium]
MPKNNLKKLISFFVLTFLLLDGFLLSQIFYKPVSSDLKVYMLNVGQGDAFYLKTPSGNDFLIDGGPDRSVLQELGQKMPFWDKDIEFAILSHPHADHIEGLNDLLDRYRIEKLVYSDSDPSSFSLQNLLERAKSLGTELIPASQYSTFTLESALEISIIEEPQTCSDQNDCSIVFKVKFNDFKMLFTGDASEKEWASILKKNPDLNSQILKVPHHGSRTGLNEDILKKIQPEIALIPVGKGNRYGLPSSYTLELLKKFNAKIYRSDLDGTVKISTDGKSYSIK